MPERILVTGAGVTGGEVARQLTTAALQTCALVRSPDRAAPLRELGVQLIEGDFANREAWKRALDGVSAVFNITVAHRDTVAWNALFLDCARQAAVRHVVQLSGMTVSPSSPAGFHQQMSQCDEALKASGLSYTILQPNVFHQSMLRMAAPIRAHDRFRSAVGDARISMIDVRDVAEVAVKVLIESGHADKTYVLTGPETLTLEVVRHSGSVASGQEIEVVRLTREPNEAHELLLVNPK